MSIAEIQNLNTDKLMFLLCYLGLIWDLKELLIIYLEEKWKIMIYISSIMKMNYIILNLNLLIYWFNRYRYRYLYPFISIKFVLNTILDWSESLISELPNLYNFF